MTDIGAFVMLLGLAVMLYAAWRKQSCGLSLSFEAGLAIFFAGALVALLGAVGILISGAAALLLRAYPV